MRYIGSLYAVISGLAYSLLGYFGITILKQGASISNMLFWRFFISFVFTVIVLSVQKRTTLDQIFTKKLILPSIIGSVLFSFSAIIFFSSCLRIGTGLAMVIFFIYPAIIMSINTIFFHEKMDKVYYITSALIFLGLILVANPNNFEFNIIGIILGVISATIYSCYIVASEKLSIDPLLSTTIVSGGSAINCFLVSYIADPHFFIPLDLISIKSTLILGIVSTAIPMALFLKSLEYIDAEKASILSVLEPVFVLLIGVNFLHEVVSINQLFGVVIILFGSVLILFHSSRKSKTTS